MNLIDISKSFATDEQCLEYIEAQRWPNGVRCLTCGADKVSRIARKTEGKNKRTRLYQCLEPSCKQQFSTTSGTIFHDSHLPLTKWFMAMALICNAKKGISAKQLERDLNVNYRTAWHLAHRIRKAMADCDTETPLSGIVEVDETYVGGKTIRKKDRGKYRSKDAVVGMVERGGRVRFRHIGKGSATTKAVKPLLLEHISPDVERIMTDESVIYPFAMKDCFEGKHSTINHSAKSYVNGEVHTNTIESAFSLLKRGVIGNFHQVSIKHLHRYLAEFEFRYNRRKEQGAIFNDTLKNMAQKQKLPYRELVKNPIS